MAHSIPDNAGVVVEAEGLPHPAHERLQARSHAGRRLQDDVGRLAELGNRGVDLMLGDSTNAERPGYTGSERLVGEAFRQIIPLRKGRILVASFASNVHRMQQAVDVALESGRKVCVVGRSMRKNLNIARSLGYMSVPDDTLVRPDELDNYPPDKVLVLCTGSQGEPLSALTRIAYNDHSSVRGRARRHGDHLGEAGAGERAARPRHDQPARARRRRDPPPGDRARARLGARELGGDPHRPRARAAAGVMPMHGEYRMLAAQAKMAGTRASRRRDRAGGERLRRRARASGGGIVDRVDSGVTFVDGLAVGDITDVALRDRRGCPRTAS